MEGLRSWMTATRSRLQGIKVTDVVGCDATTNAWTPTLCWIAWCEELLAAFDELGDCLDNIKWWDPFWPIERCELFYEIRMLADWAWWLSCIGLGVLK
jgi:hypothetical protein